MSLRYHEIAEANHHILNPFTDDKLMLLGSVSQVGPDTRVLDLACGKGELLCRWAAEFGSSGHGVDLSEMFLAAARARAAELAVTDRVSFQHADARDHRTGPDRYDLACCIGATWIGDGLAGTIDLLRRSVTPDGLILVGEPYWIDEPPPQAYQVMGMAPGDFTSLPGILDTASAAGTELVEMVLADGDSWDRYEAARWWTVERWLHTNPDHADAPAMRTMLSDHRRSHLTYRRRHLGWGVFVLRAPS